jgi:branched-chain amino acid transport system permease protein
LGYLLLAVREDEDAAQALGVNSTHVKFQAMFISAFLAAIAGSLYAQFTLFINPELFFGLFTNSQIILLTIIGGRGTILGPVIGSIIGTGASDLLIVYVGTIPAVQPLLYGLVLIIIILFEPTGIMGLVKSIQNRSTSFMTRRPSYIRGGQVSVTMSDMDAAVISRELSGCACRNSKI